ncbi:DNA polymerase-3 subunit gamma/tau [Candidatus Pelagibacter ubique]|uniref:DNA polymerase III subunit gamma/tau n=1 Tax=Pelagibacter ubique TaxID=198252 RepID=A0ABX1T346_PELUQ|nr:DNA polymerase III subunit gamma/tau [Candidatus Pelagibacter ubique]NMN67499.1 DNA polymerase-3 subunit gamma/tau [Candidatus Pelagibacter ubique]
MNKNTKVLALKYRPQTFDDLIGQEFVAETIFNSIKANKVPNAYLFTGIRGIGKTTTARIVAKSLNCLNGIEGLCKDDICENCNAISNSNHIDVLEMDAASKTGVDDVRDLIEFSRYGPTTAKYKIFIIDEVHMLSKQAFNALLKTLEEPPEYLKFIFATTEIKKIPITVVSRCQRFDLSRIKSSELFEFIKKIKEKENGKASDDALKLIVKISEGSVRDALSLLDRALLTLNKNTELDLTSAQKIFGHFDKSQLINLFQLIFEGKETEVLNTYREIYNQGVEPKIFINDFLELLYYFKNIDSLNIDGTNFSLNDEEFNRIKEISKKISNETLILFWQFAIKATEELDIVSNQHLSMEMFLIRLIHLKSIKNTDNNVHQSPQKTNDNIARTSLLKKNEGEDLFEIKDKAETIGQMKNIAQEKNVTLKDNKEIETQKNLINSFDDLLKICLSKKEIKLKYELEKNVNLVSFESQRIEISFNEKLDKDFIKDLSLKLFEWTSNRWIITLSKTKGQPSKKETEVNLKKELIEDVKNSSIYRNILKKFQDAEIVDVITNKKEEKDD